MTIEEFCTHLGDRLATVKALGPLHEKAASEIGGFFGVNSHEVAFFSVDYAQQRIVFRWPCSIAAAGHIPLKAVNSLVAKTVSERRSFIDNTFAVSRHLYVYEHLLADKAERIPVQKIMSVAIMAGDSVKGVIQVSRKGANPAEAGADFTPADLVDLELIAGVLSQHM